MKRYDPFTILVFFTILGLLAGGCGSGSRQSPGAIEDLSTEERTGIESIDQIYHLYPSPGEMLGIIDMAEMSFDPELLHPVSEADRYEGTRAMTYMLGLYMADLAYAALFERHEATLEYLETVKDLSEDIRIDQAIDDAMIEKARKNVEYLDSLYTISNEAFMNIMAFCERNERSNTVVMMSAGAFVESLYLAVNLIEDYSEVEYLLQHLADQKYTIDNFMTFAESVQADDPNVKATIEDLRAIEEIYDDIDAGTGDVTVSTSGETGSGEPKKLVIGGGGAQSQPSLSEEEFENLKAAIFELRSRMIEG